MIPEVPTTVKQPSESRVYSFDFSNLPELADLDQTIASVGTPTVDPDDDQTLVLGTPAIAQGGQKVNLRISGGTADTNYKVTVPGVVTSGGSTLEGEAEIWVRDI